MEARPFGAGKIVGLALLGVLIVLAVWVMGSYNSLVNLTENAKTAQADVEVQYQRRFDLIPNLVKTVEAIATQEQKVFKDLADARSRYAGAPTGSPDKIAAINQLDSSLARLLVVVENYPQLKSSESFLKLQDQLEGTENRIAVARNTYNDVVNQLNKKVRVFPSNIVAGIFNFEQRELFKAVEGAEVAPEVNFDFR